MCMQEGVYNNLDPKETGHQQLRNDNTCAECATSGGFCAKISMEPPVRAYISRGT